MRKGTRPQLESMNKTINVVSLLEPMNSSCETRDEVLKLEQCGILVEKGGNALVVQAKFSRSST